MRKGHSALGIIFIFLGIAVFMKNIRVLPKGSFSVLLGFFLLYLFTFKKQKFFLTLGLLAMISGTLSILMDYNFLRLTIGGESILIIIACLFIILYYFKKNIGFLIAGVIISTLGLYMFLIDYYNTVRIWPVFFILLGIAFYTIYFIALYGKENWPLVLGTMLILLGILLLGINFAILKPKILRYIKSYFWPSVLIIVGLTIILKRIRKKK